jgi:alanine dehydrogenase
VFVEAGYGQRFSADDEQLAREVGGLRSREELLGDCDVVVVPKPPASDLEALPESTVLWGWAHCVQDEAMTQAAIDRRLTLIA